ncbi:hypothetical protein CANARDRAFT_231426 [[Candida] arabinofermentans NRRL YB-2248]|uniref:NADP-dependent oxidoreductase domain-containing protein n=1 Tax=[Candida] arabinofermentans NRRL YB-2248 TaxID=983967 RepID=A0A1E4T2X0_9ASCO|nr:hypothetical protein CANARDRAFT_231426 [[Candida] arabinofermentans NRRL YB-2248]
MSSKIPKLASGIPKLGFGSGTYYFKYGNDTIDENLVSILTKALTSGVTHIDSAECYNTDYEVAKAIKQSKLPRSDIWITDKYFAGDSSYTVKSKEDDPYHHLVAALKRLDTPYVDLYLIHSPFIKTDVHGFDLSKAWGFMERCKKEGLAKHIGVSNFGVEDLKVIIDKKDSLPIEFNQIEFNAFLQNQTPGVVEFCKENNIQLEAYSPLGPLYKGDLKTGVGKLFDEYLDTLVKKYNRSKTQILLHWVAAIGIVPITTTSKESRLAEFLEVFEGFELTPEEVEKITEIGKSYKPVLRQYWKPEYSKYDS